MNHWSSEESFHHPSTSSSDSGESESRSTSEDNFVSYGLFVWISPQSKKYRPEEFIQFNQTLAGHQLELRRGHEIKIQGKGLYRIEWSVNTLQKDLHDPQNKIVNGVGRILVNSVPLKQSYTYQFLTQQNNDHRSFGTLSGKHAVYLRDGDLISLQNHPEGSSFKVISDLGKDVVGASLEIQQIS